MIRIAIWMWRCEPAVAAYQVEQAATLHRPPLDCIDLTPDDPVRKRLAILHDGLSLLEVWCSPVADTCVEMYVADPMPLAERDLIMGLLIEIEVRAISLNLVRRRVGFAIESTR